MKSLPVILALLATVASTTARPLIPELLAIINGLADSLLGTGDSEPTPDPPAAGPPPCVVEAESAWSLTCPGNPQCEDVKEYFEGDLVDFNCYLAGYVENDSDPPVAWVKIREPFGYFPRDALNKQCAESVTRICPEGEGLNGEQPE